MSLVLLFFQLKKIVMEIECFKMMRFLETLCVCVVSWMVHDGIGPLVSFDFPEINSVMFDKP